MTQHANRAWAWIDVSGLTFTTRYQKNTERPITKLGTFDNEDKAIKCAEQQALADNVALTLMAGTGHPVGEGLVLEISAFAEDGTPRPPSMKIGTPRLKSTSFIDEDSIPTDEV